VCLRFKIWSLMYLSSVFYRYAHIMSEAAFAYGYLLAISGQQVVYRELSYGARDCMCLTRGRKKWLDAYFKLS